MIIREEGKAQILYVERLLKRRDHSVKIRSTFEKPWVSGLANTYRKLKIQPEK